MPSTPKPLPDRVLVRCSSGKFAGAEKWVRRSQLDQLGPRWERVPVLERTERAKKRPPAEAVERNPVEPAEASTDQKE